MSEYQYYEFLALDQPLTAKQRAELRSISSRAKITATRWVDEYEYGDLQADPREMMERYFDASLYLANWGTRQVMVRLPRGVLDPEVAGQYCGTEIVSLIETSSHLIVNVCVEPEEAGENWDDEDARLSVMVQARSELAAGDLRLLYLAWLIALQWDGMDDDDLEPPVPAGLGKLSAGLQAIVNFFEIDQDLVTEAAVASGSAPAVPRRTAAELWEAAEDRKEARMKATQERQRKQEAREAAAQAGATTRRLDQLATRTEAAWQEVAEWIETRKPSDYDLAVSLLQDLHALAEREGNPDAFSQPFLELRTRHQRKPSLQERFDRAGLPG